MELADALAFASTHQRGVLATHKRDGRPQMSNVSHHVGDDGLIRISITADRAKYSNLRRDPRASLHVNREDFWAYVVIEGDVTLSEVASAPDDAAVDELVGYYKALLGEHPDWAEYRQAMVNDHRLIVRLAPTHVYGMLDS